MATRNSRRSTDVQSGAAPAPERGRQPRRRKPRVQKIAVARIRPEDGLGRKRDRGGHQELRRSIEQFGVLTPVTVRSAPDGSGDYLLIKGQGRTLACQMLGIEKIPAIVVGDDFADNAKVQQFLVENVARLRMRPVDRALLIARARQDGEETAEVARRFGVTAATVRRLEAQLDGASKHEVAALKKGTVNLALHAVIARHVDLAERGDVVDTVSNYALRTKEVGALFSALGWGDLAALGPDYRAARLLLLDWACDELTKMEPGAIDDRFGRLAERMPLSLDTEADRVGRAR